MSHDFTSVDVLFALIDKAFVEDDNNNFVEMYEFLQSIQRVNLPQDENKDCSKLVVGEDLKSNDQEYDFTTGKDNESKQLMKVIEAEKDGSHASTESLETAEESEEVVDIVNNDEGSDAEKDGSQGILEMKQLLLHVMMRSHMYPQKAWKQQRKAKRWSISRLTLWLT